MIHNADPFRTFFFNQDPLRTSMSLYGCIGIFGKVTEIGFVDIICHIAYDCVLFDKRPPWKY